MSKSIAARSARQAAEVFGAPVETARFVSERSLCDAIGSSLVRQGFTVERESYTPGGPVDIFAYQRQGLWRVNYQFIEAKLLCDRRTAAHALGQLLFYQTEYAPRERCNLWFACPTEPDERVSRILGRHGVSWCGPDALGFRSWSKDEIRAAVEERRARIKRGSRRG